MIERIADMPEGTIGVRVWGDVTRDDYVDVLIRALHDAVEANDEIRLVFQVGPDFDKFTAGMMAADTTKGAAFGIGHWSAWKRMAVVTDVEWLRHSMELLGWMTPASSVCIRSRSWTGRRSGWLRGGRSSGRAGCARA